MNSTGNKTQKKTLITGITGQDGAYLEKGYEIHA